MVSHELWLFSALDQGMPWCSCAHCLYAYYFLVPPSFSHGCSPYELHAPLHQRFMHTIITLVFIIWNLRTDSNTYTWIVLLWSQLLWFSFCIWPCQMNRMQDSLWLAMAVLFTSVLILHSFTFVVLVASNTWFVGCLMASVAINPANANNLVFHKRIIIMWMMCKYFGYLG